MERGYRSIQNINMKKYQIISKFPTSLTEEDLIHIQKVTVEYLKSHEYVTNRILRQIVNVTYDQAIFFFGRMIKRKVIKKVGTSSGTRYILSK